MKSDACSASRPGTTRKPSPTIDSTKSKQSLKNAVNPQTVKQLAWGVQRRGSPFSYVPPNVRGDLHNSMTAAWRILEYVPKAAKYKEWPTRKTHFGFYIPDAEPRRIPEGAPVHESVLKRMDALADYRPVNLPLKFETVPMPHPP